MLRSGHTIYPRNQSGAALLVFLLLMVTGASYVLVSKLNANVTVYSRQARSSEILRTAKAALLSYSVTYPENSVGGTPGTLPCPDITSNGVAVGNCSFGGGTTMGRFPWKTLGIGELRDDEGQHLWYVVSDNFRTPLVGQINSDTQGTLAVDSTTDIVAVIFSPGVPVVSQDRIADPLDAANYLEGGNQTNDNSYFSTSAGEFNDQLIFITRQELTTLVEKRVLGDVAQTLSAHQATAGNLYPWLSTFSDPDTSDFRGDPGLMRGHLPFHWAADPQAIINAGTIAGRNPYTTDYTFSWDTVTNAATSQTPVTSAWFTLPAPTLNCTRNMDCNDVSDLFNGLTTATQNVTGASCNWTDQDSFGCPQATFTITRPYTAYSNANLYGYKFTNGGPEYDWFYTDVDGSGGWEVAYFNTSYSSGWGTYSIRREVSGTLQRQYDAAITLTDTDGIVINAPTGTAARSRDLDLTGTLTPSTITVTVTDTYSGITDRPNYNIPGTMVSVTTLVSDADTTGNISITGMHYDLDVDGDELPEWFVENGWHELIYVAYATGEGSPPGTSVCTSGTSCITLNGAGGTIDNKRAVVVIAGQELTSTGQDRTTTPDILDYFENANSVVDDVFETDTLANFNDRVRILAEAP